MRFAALQTCAYFMLTELSARRKVFVGGVSYQTTESAELDQPESPLGSVCSKPVWNNCPPHALAGSLRDHFSRYGEITDCFVMRDKATGKPRGFAFCCFKDPEVAQSVVTGALTQPPARVPPVHRRSDSLSRVCAETHVIDGRQVGFCLPSLENATTVDPAVPYC